MAVSAAVTAGLCLAGTAALSTPSRAATGTCDTAYPVANLTQGQPVTGLTVSNGTTPSAFTGSVLGVITDGVEPGVDLVMAKLSSPDIDDAGIWEGMSGSPVYAADGSLIGAVSYTLAWGQTPIAGITPWEDMAQYAGSVTPPSLRIPTSAAKDIAGHSAVTLAQAAQGFHELKAPVVVAGLSDRALDEARHRPYLSRSASAAGHASAPSSLADMVAGGNLVATLATGDITIGGLGTITSVCSDRLVGFGHPLSFTGRTTYGLAGASALYIQKDPTGPSFKVANVGSLLGTIDQDRMTGISGTLGPTPPDLPITSQVTYTDGSTTRRRRRTTSWWPTPRPSSTRSRGVARSSRGPSRVTRPAARSRSPAATSTPTGTTSRTPRRTTSPTCCTCSPASGASRSTPSTCTRPSTTTPRT
jgi:hypothetical protein